LHRRILLGEEIDPLVDVVLFEEAEGCERAAADAVSAGVGEEYGELVGEEELRVSDHADAVVAESVKKKDGVAVRVVRTDEPGFERCSVWRSDGRVFEFCAESVCGLTGIGGVGVGEGTAGWMECAVRDEDAGDRAEGKVEREGEEEAAGCSGSQQCVPG